MRLGITLLFCLLLLSSCREAYQPPTVLAQSNLLVVDGFLDGSEGSCTVALSRSQEVSDAKEPPREKQANVQLEDSEGNVYSLIEMNDGNYRVSNVTIDTQIKYRLSIKTEAGKNYQSDYVEMKKAPPIDTVKWEATGQGLQFYVSTHDDEKKSIYYQYKFVETWAYNAPFPSDWEVIDSLAVYRKDQVYHCWSTAPSTEISIATSAKLSDDVISNFPFYLIPKPSKKYQVRYSILVKQSVLTNEAYHYWQQLQKNTEKIGTLFDPQPSQIQSNIQNVDNRDEPVLGYFNAGTTTEKRIFVSFYDLPPGWFYNDMECQLDTIFNLKVSLAHTSGDDLIYALYANGTQPYAFLYTTTACGDCRAGGGTTTKPDFW